MHSRSFPSNPRKNLILALPLAILALGPSNTYAQTTGTLYGTVTDPQGAAIAGADVTAKNVATNLSRTAATDSHGNYKFDLLPVGVYSIAVEANGFKPHLREKVELQVEQNLRADFNLEVGHITQQVIVTIEAPQIDTLSSTLGKVVEERRIRDLPLNGRNFLQLGVIQAGVNPPIPGIDSFGSGTNSTPGGTAFNFSVNGMRITSNNHLLDGVNNVEPMSGAAMIVPSPDSLLEFRILTNCYSAEFGRAGGSIVTVITKSGTNRYHGSVHEFLRNDVFDARNFFSPDVPTLKQNQFGATVGGPVRTNKTFFFAGYEGFRQRRGIPTTTVVPSLRARGGDFSQEAARPIDPLTRQPFPGGVIPDGRMDPVARNVLALYPEPNLGSNLFTHAPVAMNERDQFIARLDHTLIAGKNTLTGRYAFDEGSLLSPGGTRFNIGSTDVPGFPFATSDRYQNVMVSDTHIFSATLLNEVRLSYQRANVENQKPQHQQDPAGLGFTYPISGSPILAMPGIAVAGHSGLGYSIFNDRISNFYELVDTVAVNSGRHSVKLGGNVRHTRISSLFPSLVLGQFTFIGAVTGNPLADLVLGRPFIFLQAGGKPDKSLRQTAYSFYIQDDFPVGKGLTLNLGLRYELTPGLKERDNLALTFIEGKQSVLSATLPPGMLRPGDPGVPDTLFPTDKNNFAPRIGIAWDPLGDGKTSVRAGFGVFYDESALVQEFTVQQPPDFQPITVTILPRSFADPFLGNSPFKPPLEFPLRFPPGFTVTWTAPDLKPAYIQHWNLALQRQLSPSTAIEMAYVGNKGTRLQGTVDPNQAVWAPGATSANIAARRPNPLIGNVIQITSVFNSSYHGLQATLTRRLSLGLSLQASYTWSKAIDDTVLPIAFFTIPGQQTRPQSSRDLAAERGLSAFDVRHRFVASYIYELPFFTGVSGARSYVLRGWKLSGITTIQTGHPFTVEDTADPSLDSAVGDRTDLIRDPNLPADRRTPERWFDTTAFKRFTPPAFGNAGRNILFTDGIVNFDIGLAKDFALGEQRRLEFRWEVFNAFNHPNFGVPVNDFNSPNFGRVLRTSTPERQMQFALKFLF